MRNAAELPLEWEMGEKPCEAGEGCQDLVTVLYNGKNKSPPGRDLLHPRPSGLLHLWEELFLSHGSNLSTPSPLFTYTGYPAGCPASPQDPDLPVPTSTCLPSSVQDP